MQIQDHRCNGSRKRPRRFFVKTLTEMTREFWTSAKPAQRYRTHSDTSSHWGLRSKSAQRVLQFIWSRQLNSRPSKISERARHLFTDRGEAVNNSNTATANQSPWSGPRLLVP